MSYIFLRIEDVEFAFPEYLLTRLIKDIFLKKDGDKCIWIAPYGTCIIDAPMDRVYDLIEFGKYEGIIKMLIQNGFKKEALPIFQP